MYTEKITKESQNLYFQRFIYATSNYWVLLIIYLKYIFIYKSEYWTMNMNI